MALLPIVPGMSALLISTGDDGDVFQRAGFSVLTQHEVIAALKVLQSHDVHLVVVRGALRGWSVPELCHAIRRTSSVPLLAICDEGEEVQLAAFDAGADECLASSCSERELLTRVAALLRRSVRVVTARLLERGALRLDSGAQRAMFEGQTLALTGYEFSLLRVLAEDAGRAVSREELMERAKGSVDESFERSIDVHVCRLRAKLSRVDGGSRVLKTVRGVGYMLELNAAGESERAAAR